MPGVVAFIGASLLSGIGISAASAALIMAVGSAAIALTVATARRAAKLDDPADAGYAVGQTVSIRSTEAPRNIVYGEANVGGVFTYVNTGGNELRSLYYEIVHTGHEIDSFQGWYIDDRFVPVADVDTAGDGSVDSDSTGHELDDASGTPVLYLRGHLGTSAQTVDSMLDSAFIDIGSNHRHRGCSKSVVRCELVQGHEDKWDGQPPNTITAVERGMKVYDPREDSTFSGGSGSQRLNDPATWAWSDNPALLWANYRTLAKPLGPAWATDRINWQSVFDAADDCDALVAIPTAATEKRFRCDLVVDTAMEPQEVVNQILATMAGHERLVGGQWHVYAGVWPTPDFALDESDLVGPVHFRKQPDTSSQDRYNQVKGEYYDRERLWKLSPFLPVDDTSLRSSRDNNRVLTKHLRLEGVSREYQAQRLAIRALRQAEDSGILVFTAGYSAANIRVGDTGTVTLSEFGWTEKTFRCVGVRAIDFQGYELRLKEDESVNYDDPDESEYSTRTAAGEIVFGTVLPWYLQGQPANGMWTPNLVNVTREGSTYTKTGGANNTFDSSVYSLEGYSRAMIAFKALQTDKNVDVGFNAGNPASAHDRNDIDYAIIHGSDGNLYRGIGGTPTSLGVTYNDTDLLALAYDGTFMRWYKNDELLYSVAVGTPNTIYFLDSSFYETGAGIYELSFAPLGNVSTNQIDPEAATEVFALYDAGPLDESVGAFGNNPGALFTGATIIVFTTPSEDVIDITATFDLELIGGPSSIARVFLGPSSDLESSFSKVGATKERVALAGNTSGVNVGLAANYGIHFQLNDTGGGGATLRITDLTISVARIRR